MKNKLPIFVLPFVLLVSCSPNEQELKMKSDEIYNQVKVIPESEPCLNLKGYKKLQAYESKYKTTFYSELTSKKIKEYEKKCSKKLIAIERERKRKAELKKLGSWSTGIYVDEFGDRTGEGFIKLTTYGFFSNSATTDSRLRVEMMLSNGSIEEPWFRFYEYDGANAVKGIFDDKNPINCRVKNDRGDVFPIELYQRQGWDGLYIHRTWKTADIDVKKLRKSILDEGIAKFSCYKERYSSSKYRFNLNFKYFSNVVRKYKIGDDWNSQ